MRLPKYFKNLVNEIEKLPGLGQKTAMRLALFLVHHKGSNISRLISALSEAKSSKKFCDECGGLSDDNTCDICLSYERDAKKLCVVENILDMIAIEKVGFFRGKYHILGGVISPIDDVSINELNLNKLLTRLNNVEEIIYALPSSVESDATFLLLKDAVLQVNPKIVLTKVAIGLPFGSNIDYADSLTLIRSFENRIKS